jgi:hypothetical protein
MQPAPPPGPKRQRQETRPDRRAVEVFSPCHATPLGQARENWPQFSNIILENIKRFLDDQSVRKKGGVSAALIWGEIRLWGDVRA